MSEITLQKRILQMCVSSLQKARSITEENGGRELEELMGSVGLGSSIFNYQVETLMTRWNDNKNPTRHDAVNAIQWLNMKYPQAFLILSMNMAEAGLGRFVDNPIQIYEDVDD